MDTESLEQDSLHFRRVSGLAPKAEAWELPQSRRHVIACLPTVACVALGGTPEQAQTSQEVWALLYDAADAFDQVQDNHVNPALTPARVISVGISLLFSATERLGRLPASWQAIVYPLLHETVDGQAEDVIKRRPTIQEALAIADKKTGASFALGCALGALSAGAVSSDVAALSTYGRALGTMLQIHDDLELVEGLGQARPQALERFSNIALAYAWEKLAPAHRDEVLSCLEAFGATGDRPPAERAYQILVHTGARLYCAIEVATRWQKAREALATVRWAESREQTALYRLVDELVQAFKAPP